VVAGHGPHLLDGRVLRSYRVAAALAGRFSGSTAATARARREPMTDPAP